MRGAVFDVCLWVCAGWAAHVRHRVVTGLSATDGARKPPSPPSPPVVPALPVPACPHVPVCKVVCVCALWRLRMKEASGTAGGLAKGWGFGVYYARHGEPGHNTGAWLAIDGVWGGGVACNDGESWSAPVLRHAACGVGGASSVTTNV
jgi:hypothetical protein